MKTKIFGVFILAIFSLCMASGVNAVDKCTSIEISEEWVVLNPGEEFEMVLLGNPSTGYMWITDYDPRYIELVKQTYIPDNTYRCGSRGIYIFTFKALKIGNADINMKYLRPWENCAPAKETIYHLKIIKDGHDLK